MWHEMLGIDPDTCRALLEDSERRREAMRVISSYAKKQSITI